MQPVPEKRVSPTTEGVEVAPAGSAEAVERIVPVEATLAAPVETIEQGASGAETVDVVREQLAQGGDASATQKAGDSSEGDAVVILFPNVQERNGFEGQSPEGKVLALLHASQVVVNPGATIRLLQEELSKAA